MATSQRSRQRGTVMVESLIVISMLTIALIAAYFLHDVAYGQMTTMRIAKNEAWTQAMPGCGASAAVTGDSLSSTLDDADSLTDDGSGSTSIEGHTVSSSQSADVPGLGGDTFAVSANAEVVCNEQAPEEADLGTILTWGISELVPGGSFF
jgi:hypothetical protein